MNKKLIITGFESFEQMKCFIEWFGNQGEQNASEILRWNDFNGIYQNDKVKLIESENTIEMFVESL